MFLILCKYACAVYAISPQFSNLYYTQSQLKRNIGCGQFRFLYSFIGVIFMKKKSINYF